MLVFEIFFQRKLFYSSTNTYFHYFKEKIDAELLFYEEHMQRFPKLHKNKFSRELIFKNHIIQKLNEEENVQNLK